VELRPEQQPEADRVFVRWTDTHRHDQLGAALRRMAYQAARFDSTPSADEMAALKRDIEQAEQTAHDLLVKLEEIAQAIAQFAESVAALNLDRADFQVFGMADDDELLDRLSRLYNLWEPGQFRSQNGLRR